MTAEPLTPAGRLAAFVRSLDISEDAAYAALTDIQALDAARKASPPLDVERLQEAWRRAERAVNVGGHRLTPHDVAREYAALDPTP